MKSCDIRNVFKRLLSENDGKQGKAIQLAKDEIDQCIASTVIDDSFYQELYELKQAIYMYNSVVPSLLTGLYTGGIMTLLLPFVEMGVWLWTFFLVVGVISVPVFLYLNMRLVASVPICILYPYVVQKMEVRIMEKEMNTVDLAQETDEIEKSLC